MKAQTVTVTELSESIEQSEKAVLWKLEVMGFGLTGELGPDSVVPEKALFLLGYKKKDVKQNEKNTVTVNTRASSGGLNL
jgi:hypothetical protein